MSEKGRSPSPRRARTCRLRGCSLPAVIVLRWPWSRSALPLCAEHWPDLSERGMVTHERSTVMICG